MKTAKEGVLGKGRIKHIGSARVGGVSRKPKAGNLLATPAKDGLAARR